MHCRREIKTSQNKIWGKKKSHIPLYGNRRNLLHTKIPNPCTYVYCRSSLFSLITEVSLQVDTVMTFWCYMLLDNWKCLSMFSRLICLILMWEVLFVLWWCLSILFVCCLPVITVQYGPKKTSNTFIHMITWWQGRHSLQDTMMTEAAIKTKARSPATALVVCYFDFIFFPNDKTFTGVILSTSNMVLF